MVSQVNGAFSSAVDSVKDLFGFSNGEAKVNVSAQSTSASVPALASGGIVSKPTMALSGESEAVMPLSKLSSLLQSNASPANPSSSITVHFSPNITINGGDNVKAQVNEALVAGQINLKKSLCNYLIVEVAYPIDLFFYTNLRMDSNYQTWILINQI